VSKPQRFIRFGISLSVRFAPGRKLFKRWVIGGAKVESHLALAIEPGDGEIFWAATHVFTPKVLLLVFGATSVCEVVDDIELKSVLY
jgi:hypothetical protein